ncbi:hypothetical protein Ddye_030849 [Dipteronia dyeriana]|uniref:Uncharacterized protein n=1 Tax=Dipteronia dyeriana TaxID=168575 RepID=A0AAD9THT4_9ROSI|nr:hypothetical protein Ddye_030849 [Dipteronia dyeriana]
MAAPIPSLANPPTNAGSRVVASPAGPTSLDDDGDDEENPDPHIASQTRDMRINVKQVIREEVGVDRGVIVSNSSDDQHTSDGNSGGKDDGDNRDSGDESRG